MDWSSIVIFITVYIILGMGVAAGIKTALSQRKSGILEFIVITLAWPPIFIGIITIRLLV